MDPKKYFIIKVTGKVQGVFFRASTAQKANELQIKGFVKNENDGSVYIEAIGEESNLKNFILWCHNGPEKAIVSKVETTAVEKGKNFEDFKVLK